MTKPFLAQIIEQGIAEGTFAVEYPADIAEVVLQLVQLGVNNPTVSPGLNAQLFKYFAPKYSYLTCYVKQPIFITVGRLTPRNARPIII